MTIITVADPELQIRGGGGGGGGHTDPEIREEGCGLSKKFFGPQFGLKIKGSPSPHGPFPGSVTK